VHASQGFLRKVENDGSCVEGWISSWGQIGSQMLLMGGVDRVGFIAGDI
jgi:hypothetical protein